MKKPTNTTEVIAYLRGQGLELAALLIENLRNSEQSCRRAAEDNLRLYYEIKDKYEPQPRRCESWVRWTGD